MKSKAARAGLQALDRELKTKNQRYIAILEVAGISGWRATIRPLPKPLPIQSDQTTNDHGQKAVIQAHPQCRHD
jgi:hypothetical protein